VAVGDATAIEFVLVFVLVLVSVGAQPKHIVANTMMTSKHSHIRSLQ